MDNDASTPLRLIDAQCGFGGAVPGQAKITTAAELVAEMDRLTIAQALVRITPEALDSDPWRSNERLYAACAEHPGRLLPCPVMMPNGARDAGPEEEQLDAHLRRGARAVCLRPQPDSWILAPWASGPLFAALAARLVPAICLAQNGFSLEAVAELAGRHPDLPVVFSVDSYRTLRTLLPLLRTFPNAQLLIGPLYTYHAGLEQLVVEVGPERLLFGSGFPVAEAMAAVTQLTYADLPAAARRRIGAENLERLLRGVRA